MRSRQYGRSGFPPYQGTMAFSTYKTDIVDLKGGINENVSSLELVAGELIDCKNYMVAEGGYGGYISTKGYEAFDGTVVPSTYESIVLTVESSTLGVVQDQVITGGTSGATVVSLETVDPVDGTMDIQCILDTGSLEQFESLSTVSGAIGSLEASTQLFGGDVVNHLALDLVHTLVTEVPGEGSILGLHIFESNTYAFRKHIGASTIGFYVEDASTGWLEIDTSADPIVYTGSHSFYFDNYNFYAGTDTLAMYWCDGQNQARAYDGTTVTTIDNTGMGTDDKPIRIVAHNYHLWLAYTGGSLQHSKVGDPDIWDGVLGAGEIGMGQEITNLVAGVKSSLIITLTDGIRTLTGNITDDFVLEVYSKQSGAVPMSTQRLLGTVFFLDDRGITTLESVDEYGDYTANSISQRFKTTLLDPNHTLTTTLTSRELNQYRLFFDDKTAIYVSFEAKEFLGATFMEFDRNVSVAAQGDKGSEDLAVFASDDETGYVYRMDSGTSFNGTPIICRMATAFYHYGSPRTWKAFKKATVEIFGEKDQSFDLKVDFDYNEGNIRTIWYAPSIYTVVGSGVYSTALWGTLIYGANAVTNRAPVYLQGLGTNMSYKILSNETYRPQHVIQNIITDYELLSRRV